MGARDEVVSKGPLAPVVAPIDFRRYPVTGEAAALVRHYWLVDYALPPGASHDVPILVYPACNLVIEHDRARLYAPTPDLTVRHLEGSGFAFGVLLQVATGYRLAGRPVEDFVGDSIDFSDEHVVTEVRDIMGASEDAVARHPSAIAAFEEWLAARVPSLTTDERLMNEIAAAIETDAALTRVDELAGRFGLSPRRLERLAARYVGLTPKWMIQRRRLQEAAARLGASSTTDLSGLAAELGYADYPHFSRDFAATVGMTPRDFAATLKR
ncbi:helix-turn-helix domain-containing protein [Gryllotalpicola koreensis]|uniref:Helix-turn-helix domain-containing protein n=1 Tax=Gryllotalpicola koreensis TaxID=993086 RepID=A0ABP7ZVG7_9MICO